MANALDEANEPKRETTDCAQGADDRKSDLCAQWKAADAATQGATAADRSVVIGWIGLALGAITMGAALAAAYFAKLAADHTKRGADATHDANRPWIEIKSAGASLVTDDTGVHVRGTCLLENRGDSPATDVLVYARLVAMPLGFSDPKVPTDKVRAVLEKWENSDTKLGVCIFPQARARRDFTAVMVPEELARARGEPPLEVFYTVAVGVRYSFAGRHGQTVTAYDFHIAGGPVDYDNGAFLVQERRITLKAEFGGYAI